MIHDLKCWPEGFQAVLEGTKSHEVRPNDRRFQVGDTLHLREFEPHEECQGRGRVWGNGDTEDCGCPKPHGRYTGRECEVEISYITEAGTFGLPENRLVMSIRKCDGTKLRVELVDAIE